MDKKKIVGVFGGIIVILLLWSVFQYNSLVQSKETIITQQANISTALQRRADLIPNLVKTVQSFTSHEAKVIDNVLEARKLLMDAATLEEQEQADKAIRQSLSDLLVVVENYPELKSDAAYIALMDELAGSENRIAVARRDYNTAVQNYNRHIISFPTNILARMFGFKKADYFEAESGSEQVPNIETMLGE